MTKRVVHYVNQFFAGQGGEESAHLEPVTVEGALGPGLQLQTLLGDEAQVVATVWCGDNHFAENLESTRRDVLRRIASFEPDLVIAGPAFNAGRYGMACGEVCRSVTEELNIPALTGLYHENPGVEIYSRDIYIVPVAASARGMKTALQAMGTLAAKLLKGELQGTAEEEGYLPRGRRKNFFFAKNGAVRAVDMALAKFHGQPFKTEFEMPVFDRVPPAPALKDLKGATIALVNSGGVVPMGNPDRIEVSSASHFGRYSVESLEDLTAQGFESVHGGYDRTYVNDDPDRVVPLDALRALEKEGVFGRLYGYYYSTVGTGTPVKNCSRFGTEIAEQLKADGVDAVILTST